MKKVKESFLLYIEDDKVICNMISVDEKMQEIIREFIDDNIKTCSLDKFGLHQFVTKYPSF